MSRRRHRRGRRRQRRETPPTSAVCAHALTRARALSPCTGNPRQRRPSRCSRPRCLCSCHHPHPTARGVTRRSVCRKCVCGWGCFPLSPSLSNVWSSAWDRWGRGINRGRRRSIAKRCVAGETTVRTPRDKEALAPRQKDAAALPRRCFVADAYLPKSPRAALDQLFRCRKNTHLHSTHNLPPSFPTTATAHHPRTQAQLFSQDLALPYLSFLPPLFCPRT